MLAASPAAPYDVVFSDPPYPMSDAEVAADLVALVAHGWLVPGALVVVERPTKRSSVSWPDGHRGGPHEALRRDRALVRSRHPGTLTGPA